MSVCRVNQAGKNARLSALKTSAERAVRVFALRSQALVIALKNELVIYNLRYDKLPVKELRFLIVVRIVRVGNKICAAEIRYGLTVFKTPQ